MADFQQFEKPARPDYPDARGEDYGDRGATGPGPSAASPSGSNDYQTDFSTYNTFRTGGAAGLTATADPVRAGEWPLS